MGRGVVKLSLYLSLAILFSIASAAQSDQRDASAWHWNGSISGTLHTVQGVPVANARVELLDGGTGQVKDSTYTNPNGSFTLMRIADGIYEVVAVSGLEETRERLQVHGELSMLNLVLRRAGESATRAGNRATVSVAQMKVPERRELYLPKRNRHWTSANWKRRTGTWRKRCTFTLILRKHSRCAD